MFGEGGKSRGTWKGVGRERLGITTWGEGKEMGFEEKKGREGPTIPPDGEKIKSSLPIRGEGEGRREFAGF